MQRPVVIAAVLATCIAVQAQVAAPPQSATAAGGARRGSTLTYPSPDMTVSPKPALPISMRKNMQRAVEDLRAGKLRQAESHLKKARKNNPGSADVNYLLGLLFIERREPGKAKPYLEKAALLDATHVRAMTMLGKVRVELGDEAGAIQDLEQAVRLDPQYYMAHLLLANAYLSRQEYEKCRQAATAAIQTGKGAGHAAELPLGEALANLGRRAEAAEALTAYLQHVPDAPDNARVRTLIAELKTSGEQAALGAPPVPLLAPVETRSSLPSWGPPSIDDWRPPVTPGVSCPEAQVIDAAGERVRAMMEDVARFEAIEEVVHEDLDAIGMPLTRDTRKFGYIATAAVENAGPKWFEYRKFVSAESDFPHGIGTYGLPALVLVFHPGMRDNYDWTCEGNGTWQGQSAWVVYFRQRADRPNRMLRYNLGTSIHNVDLKGRAWVDAASFQIVHMEAELVRPLPEIKLLVHHEVIDYGRVEFPAKNTELWLPKKAVLHFHFRGYRYRRSHTFDNFKLFSVDTTEKVTTPKQ